MADQLTAARDPLGRSSPCPYASWDLAHLVCSRESEPVGPRGVLAGRTQRRPGSTRSTTPRFPEVVDHRIDLAWSIAPKHHHGLRGMWVLPDPSAPTSTPGLPLRQASLPVTMHRSLLWSLQSPAHPLHLYVRPVSDS
jgi:hypothetical protein